MLAERLMLLAGNSPHSQESHGELSAVSSLINLCKWADLALA